MTQKEKIKAEIEGLLKCYKNDIQALEKECYTNNVCAKYLTLNAQTKIDVCRQILSFINSLQAETVSEELEEEITRYFSKNPIKHPIDWPALKNTALHFANWQKEQKPADKVEPKFHEGEWITNGNYTWKIVEVKPLHYRLQSQNGNIVDDTISYVDKQFHPFTIKDAQDGDVLTEGSCIFIFKELNHEHSAKIYCCWFNDDDDFDVISTLVFDEASTYPATKEQRDLLFQKMTESGYEWDAEKKELKEIHVIDEGKDEMDYCFTKMMKGEKVTPAWSKKDEKMLKETLALIETVEYINKVKDGFLDVKMWLKSLKDRYT